MPLLTDFAGFSDLTLFAGSFLFVFAVVFALLSYSGIFHKEGEKPDRRLLSVISAAIALVSATYQPFLMFMQGLLPLATIMLIVLFFIVFVHKVFVGKKEEGKQTKDTMPAIVALAALLLVAVVLWQDFAGALRTLVPGMSVESVVGLLAVFIVIAIFGLAYMHKPEA